MYPSRNENPEILSLYRLVNKTHAIAFIEVGMQVNQIRAGSITNLTENLASKSVFFSEDSKETCP